MDSGLGKDIENENSKEVLGLIFHIVWGVYKHRH